MLEILEYSFMQRALISGICISGICSAVGCFLVMRRFALFGDGIAHVAFGGVAVGFFMGVYPLWTAFVVSTLGSLCLQKMQNSKISGDIAIAIVLVTGLSVGLILTSMSGGFSIDLFSFLFGSIILVSTNDMITILIASSMVATIILLFYRKLLFITFSPELARVSGIRVTLLNYMLAVVAAVTVVTAMRLTGILLITALIVIPTVSAAKLNRGFKATMAISIIISSTAVVSGIFVSYVTDWAPAGTVVILLVLILVVIHLVYMTLERLSR